MYDRINALIDADAQTLIDFVHKKGIGECKVAVARGLMRSDKPSFRDLLRKVQSYDFEQKSEPSLELLDTITADEFVDFVKANLRRSSSKGQGCRPG